MTIRLYLAAAAILAILAIGGGIYLAGRQDEARSIENKNLKATERQRAERDNIDAEMRDMDDAALCPWLDGLWRDGKCE